MRQTKRHNDWGNEMADDGDRYQRGRAVILDVWGQADGTSILDRWRDLSPDLERQIVEYMYGDRWTLPAPAPDLKTRSLVHVATLTALGRATQLRVHLVGALRSGNTEREIVETILQVGLLAGFPTSWDALAVCNEVFAEQRRRPEDGG
jgi:4-carboxymuconolactone decarboxylase